MLQMHTFLLKNLSIGSFVKLSKKAIKDILDSMLGIIKTVTDTTYHQVAWVKGVYGVGFDDIVCSFFDLGDPVLEEYREYGLSEYQYKVLKEFRDDFDDFSEEHSWPPTFIHSPEWATIMEKAKEVLRAFNYKSE